MIIARPNALQTTTVILLRTNYMDDRLHAFLDRLRRESGLSVYVLADETQSPVETGKIDKLSLRTDVLQSMKLHCPADFGWRCGDYGFYLARRRLPEVQFFWMIEPDTRPNWPDYRDLFTLFAEERADFIAPHYREVDRSDYWFPTMRWRSPHVWRCLFGFTRMSARAADLCWRERVRCRRRVEALLMWPNDETFVATTIAAKGLVGKDLNQVRPSLCTWSSFDFHTPKAGETFDSLEPDGLIYHPVLYGAMYERKRQKVAAISDASILTPSQRREHTRLRLLRAWCKLREGRIPGLLDQQ